MNCSDLYSSITTHISVNTVYYPFSPIIHPNLSSIEKRIASNLALITWPSCWSLRCQWSLSSCKLYALVGPRHLSQGQKDAPPRPRVSGKATITFNHAVLPRSVSAAIPNTITFHLFQNTFFLPSPFILRSYQWSKNGASAGTLLQTVSLSTSCFSCTSPKLISLFTI